MNGRVGAGLLGSWLLATVCLGQRPKLARLDSILGLPRDTTYVNLMVDLARSYQNNGNIKASIELLKSLLTEADLRKIKTSLRSDGLVKAYY